MNNIYVDELPKSCNECFCSIEDTWCGASNGDVGDICYEIDNKIRSNHCPLKLLKDALAEERKKVIQEIKDKISDGLYQNSYGETFIDGDIYDILDQIERGK